MLVNVSGSKIASRFAALADRHGGTSAADRLDQAQRRLLTAIAEHEPVTLGEVARGVGRGAPATSRAVDSLVRAGLVERTQDPDNRRRLALRVSDAGRDRLRSRPAAHSGFADKLDRLAQSELRAIERAIEILERLPG